MPVCNDPKAMPSRDWDRYDFDPQKGGIPQADSPNMLKEGYQRRDMDMNLSDSDEDFFERGAETGDLLRLRKRGGNGF